MLFSHFCKIPIFPRSSKQGNRQIEADATKVRDHPLPLYTNCHDATKNVRGVIVYPFLPLTSYTTI